MKKVSCSPQIQLIGSRRSEEIIAKNVLSGETKYMSTFDGSEATESFSTESRAYRRRRGAHDDRIMMATRTDLNFMKENVSSPPILSHFIQLFAARAGHLGVGKYPFNFPFEPKKHERVLRRLPSEPRGKLLPIARRDMCSGWKAPLSNVN